MSRVGDRPNEETNVSETNHRREAEEWLQASGVWESPGARSIPTMLAALTHAVLALAEAHAAPAVEPGPCWHDSGITWPNGVAPRCELRAGHAGAHECSRGAMGGTAVWTATTPAETKEAGQ